MGAFLPHRQLRIVMVMRDFVNSFNLGKPLAMQETTMLGTVSVIKVDCMNALLAEVSQKNVQVL